MSGDSESDYKEEEEEEEEATDSNEWNPDQANVLTFLDRMGVRHITTQVEPSDFNAWSETYNWQSIDLNSYRSRLVCYQLFYKKETHSKEYEYLSLLIKALDRHQRVSRGLLSKIYKTLGDIIIPTLQK